MDSERMTYYLLLRRRIGMGQRGRGGGGGGGGGLASTCSCCFPLTRVGCASSSRIPYHAPCPMPMQPYEAYITYFPTHTRTHRERDGMG
ncbi:hypothetical protein K445DRAFT_110914 [Daldinia sp. EC12]|nr:hypothetical protein K445DRAFT_110914 [Daldinia sp. EC12]